MQVGSSHTQIGYELEAFTEVLSLCTKTRVSGIERACGPLIFFFFHNIFIHALNQKKTLW